MQEIKTQRIEVINWKQFHAMTAKPVGNENDWAMRGKTLFPTR